MEQGQQWASPIKKPDTTTLTTILLMIIVGALWALALLRLFGLAIGLISLGAFLLLSCAAWRQSSQTESKIAGKDRRDAL